MARDDEPRWYLRHQGKVRGPYAADRIARYLKLGELREEDPVSTDGKHWAAISAQPQLLEALKRPAKPKPAGGVMGAGEEELPPHRLKAREELWAAERRAARDTRGAWLSGLLVLLLSVGLGYVMWDRFKPVELKREADCNAAPSPGVNWENCVLGPIRAPGADLQGAFLRNTQAMQANLNSARLGGADLAYAQLAGADLLRADLRGADLTGSTLIRADLRGADLRQANLSFADLRGAQVGGVHLEGARLERAIWVDGRICAPGSVGGCR